MTALDQWLALEYTSNVTLRNYVKDLTWNCHKLALRRASSTHASTSQPLSTRVSAHPYGYSHQPYANNKAKAVAIPWQGSPDDSWDEVNEQGLDFGRFAPERTAALASPQPKALKINRDLLLYRARMLRRQAFKMKSFSERAEVVQQAEAMLRRCIELDPTDARAYNALGKHLQLERRFEEAGKVYDDGIAVTGGQNAYLWQSWAVLERKQGNIAQARKYFKAAVLVDPGHAAAWHAWGMLEKEGNFSKAKDIWMKGVKKTVGIPNPHLYNSLAVLAGESGFVDEARAWFKEGTNTVKGAQSHALWHAWAQLEELRGEPRAVRYLYRKGLEVSPGSRYIHLAWAMFEKAEGQYQNARELLERGNKLNPNDAAILQAWAILEEEEGNVVKARQLFRAASRADPQMVHVWQAWGMLEQRFGDFHQARKLFRSAIWSSNNSTDACKVWQAWAILEYKAGNHGLARSMHSCAVKADPESDTAWESWIRMEERLEQYKMAEQLTKARLSGRAGVDMPMKFLGPDSIAPEQEPNLLDTVATTVRDWIRKFDSKRQFAQRRPPSYLVPPANDSLLEEQQQETPLDIQDMIAFDRQELNLKDIPTRRPWVTDKDRSQA